MLPTGGRRRLLRLMEGKLCCSSRCARQQLPSFGDMEKLHFKEIPTQKPGFKVLSQLLSVCLSDQGQIGFFLHKRMMEGKRYLILLTSFSPAKGKMWVKRIPRGL